MIFAVCGGDERLVRLSAQLLRDEHRVRLFALEGAPAAEGARSCAAAAEAVAGADCVVLPMPALSPRGLLNAPLSAEPHCAGELLSAAHEGQVFCAGMATEELRAMADGAGVRLFDYGRRGEFEAANSVATAEGAIALLLRETDSTLWGQRILICGRGRIARALAPRLRALGAGVCVSSRTPGDMAWTRAEGLEALDTRALCGRLGAFGIVVNTVPALTLTAARLAELPEGALVLDLASRPGGTDFEAARAFGIRALHAPGLPGKWSPETAAGAIREAVYNILEEVRQ